eukprot:gene27166-29968_t
MLTLDRTQKRQCRAMPRVVWPAAQPAPEEYDVPDPHSMPATIDVRLNQQQLELIDRTIAGGAAPDRASLIRLALRELAAIQQVVFEWLLAPGTGKAIELLAGQILRIEQAEGLQCVDFNAFNLHDYKEFMHCGRTRTVHGFNPSKGTFMWSAPPRERAMLYILEDTYGRNDVLFPRCSAYVYESAYGFDRHTNCHDIQAEAQREYGLTPDDVHDSFNLFMCTEVSLEGRATITRQETRAGDYVDLLALVDTLAIPNVCGADVMRTSNFALKPIKLTVFEATNSDLAAVPP